MEVLKIGMDGDYVIKLQKLLKEKGYKITVDGIFGKNTEITVENFQKDNNLLKDGIVGKSTWNILLNDISDNTPNRINDTRFVLPLKNYYRESYEKKNLVLHHTNGWTVVKGTKNKPSMNHFHWWTSYWGESNNRPNVGTAYSIDYNGNIYEHFNPTYWAYHLGLGGAKNYLDKQSIGIELVNEGFLTKEKNNKFFWYSGKVAIPYNRPQDDPIFVKDGWRDYNWFAPYSKEQVNSTIWLVKYLSHKYNIEKNVVEDFDYHPELLDGSYNGIYSHCNVRKYPSKRPKWDISPAFDLSNFKASI